jgi:hypothetical protein
MEKNSLRNNIFYNLVGKRWVVKKEPLSFSEFKECLIDESGVCSVEPDLDQEKLISYYSKYVGDISECIIPVYKKSRPSLYFGFTRTNASINFYLDRCYIESAAKAVLSKRQNTVSLESFVKKYGNEIGSIKFGEYVTKWKNTISKHDKNDLYKNWKNTPENYMLKINPNTGCNYTMEEALLKIKNDLSKGFKKVWKEYREGSREKSMINTTLEYYTNKGLSHAEAAIELNKRQSTFSLEKCILKYGDVEGRKRFYDRNKKWLDTLSNKPQDELDDIKMRKCRNLPRFSKESKDFFDSVMNEIGDLNMDVYYGSNEMVLWDRVLKAPFFYDFAIPEIKVIIEYNGSTFHPNVQLLSKSELNEWKCPFTKQNAEEKHKKDEYKNNFARSLGYDVIVVWDSDEFEYKKNKCIELINKNIK